MPHLRRESQHEHANDHAQHFHATQAQSIRHRSDVTHNSFRQKPSQLRSRKSRVTEVASRSEVAGRKSQLAVTGQTSECLFVCLFVGLFVCPCIGQPSSRLSASAMPAKGQNFGRCLKGPKLHQAKHTQPLSSAPLSSALLSSAPLSSAPLSSAPLSSSPS